MQYLAFGDKRWSNKRNWKLSAHQENLKNISIRMNASVISLTYVDYLIETRFTISQRSCPLESKLIELLLKEELKSNYKDSFDKLCNILSVFEKNYVDVFIRHRNVFSQFFQAQGNRFNAVFDLFERLKIYDVHKNNQAQKPGRDGDVDVKTDNEKEDDKNYNNSADKMNGGHDLEDDVVTSLFLNYFARYTRHICDRNSWARLEKLLKQYRWFVDGAANGAVKSQFCQGIGENPDVMYSPRFVPLIKNIIKNYTDEEKNLWYLQYWDWHGIKGVVDIIYKCQFNFDQFCNLLTQHQERLKQCKFEDWLELIVCPSADIPKKTKLIIADNPPLKLNDIMNIKNEKQRNDYLERLKLVLNGLLKGEDVTVCAHVLEHLLHYPFPNLDSPTVYPDQDPKVVQFFAGKAGQSMIRFINELREATVELSFLG